MAGAESWAIWVFRVVGVLRVIIDGMLGLMCDGEEETQLIFNVESFLWGNPLLCAIASEDLQYS
jgi:hypothetical protein